jgi:hypothetical protein
MRKVILVAVLLAMASSARGAVTTRVCLADGNTPLEYQEIMVGTKLTIIVESNEPLYGGSSWMGTVALLGDDVNMAVLPFAAPLEAAGLGAVADPWENQGIRGWDLYIYTDPCTNPAAAGDWFIVEYTAAAVGNCNVSFFDPLDPDPPYEPTYLIPFIHVPTRDFDASTVVDFNDFAVLASYWQQANCGDCGGADLSDDNDVDFEDLMLFTEYWLERTE